MSRASSSRGGRRGVYVESPGADIYTALLAIALAGIVIACLFLALELNRYGWDASAPSAALQADHLPAASVAVARVDGPSAGATGGVPWERQLDVLWRT